MLGLPKEFGITGEYADILAHYGLVPAKIAESVTARLAQL
jgi:transketolase C-terminal domain/subunit